MKKKVNIYKNRKIRIYNDQFPKISVIIPNYNYQDFIIERIDSILFQTLPVYEIIVLDDCSTDNSVDIISKKIDSIKEKYPEINIKLVKNKKNSGSVFAQWKKGLSLIKGDYFWIAEADDSCDSEFLEKLFHPFKKDSNLLISYCDSLRIDENNVITHKSCKDLIDIYNCRKWNSSYINDGINEIINSLSYNNTIINVSSVLWKNSKIYNDIFESAKKFNVAGDWYIYCEVLKHGNISYTVSTLNYFRKHSKSVSTIVKKNKEYSEIFEIQESVRKEFNLPKDIVNKQVIRRRMMGFVENDNNKGQKASVAWFVPALLKGSGGHRTIFQNINSLIEAGYKCDVYVGDDESVPCNYLKKSIDEFYGPTNADVYAGWNLVKDYDVVVATAYNTVPPVVKCSCKKKLYFVQDYEPYFFPMGDLYIEAENTYKNDISVISIGKWLSSKMKNEFNLNASFFNFCADLNVYKKLDNIEKEKAICFIFQPNKPRRCDKIAINALKIVKEIEPDVKIYLYGSNGFSISNLDYEMLGIIPIDKCNELYNKCLVGLCMSSSNPSRIPFEMMAAGLPVVELYRENNLYDLPSDGCLLSDATSEAVASALLEVIKNKKLRNELSSNGIKYMKNFPLEYGYNQFVSLFEQFINSNKFSNIDANIIYDKPMFLPTKEVLNVSSRLNLNSSVSATGKVTVLTNESFVRKLARKIIPLKLRKKIKYFVKKS